MADRGSHHGQVDLQGAQGGMKTFFIIVFCCFAIVILPFAITDLIYAFNDKSLCLNQPITKFSIAVTLKQWLQVDGYTGIAVVSLFLLVAIIGCVSPLAGAGLFACSMCILILYGLFRFAWLIVGAIMFWGELHPGNTCGRSLSDYMWVMLIISLIFGGCNICPMLNKGGSGSFGVNGQR